MAKISISLPDDEIAWLRARARKRHAGNLSAALSEAAQLLRHLDSMDGLLDRLGAPRLTEAETDALDAEITGASPVARRRRRAA